MTAAAMKPTKRGGSDFMSSHRVSLMMPRLTDRRVRQAKELYAPDEQHGGSALAGGDEMHALDKSAAEDGGVLLVRRAERRVGKKPLVLKAKLESGGSCLVGGTVRIRAKVKNSTSKTVSLVKVYLAEREVDGGGVVKRKGVVEEYLQGGVFPMVGEGAYAGFLSYVLPTNTRPSNQWRTHDLWVGLKIKGSIPGKLWVSFPLQVIAESQLLLSDDSVGLPVARVSISEPYSGKRGSVVGVMSDPAIPSSWSDSPPSSPLSSSSSATLRTARRPSIRSLVGQSPTDEDAPSLADPRPSLHKSSDATSLRGNQTLRARNSKFNRLSRTLSLTISKSWFAKEHAADEESSQSHHQPPQP